MSDIDVTLAKLLVGDQFPQWSHLSMEPVTLSGWDNRMFRLGKDKTVRFPSAQEYEAQVDKEQTWLPLLAHSLPLPIPTPLAQGTPAHDYPFRWSIYNWIPGENAFVASIGNMRDFASELAHFLSCLQKIDITDAPLPGPHNFFRGGSLTTYDQETRRAIRDLREQIDDKTANLIWNKGLESEWTKEPVWIHGDMHPTNLLVENGRLSAVIDFGCSGVGDPSCDLAIAWTFFSGTSREDFHDGLDIDDNTWDRGRAWALWKSLITINNRSVNDTRLKEARHVLNQVIQDFELS